MKLTNDEINQIMTDARNGALSDDFCRWTIHYMMGYLRFADNIENARQDFFKQVKHHLETKAAFPSILTSEERKGLNRATIEFAADGLFLGKEK